MSQQDHERPPGQVGKWVEGTLYTCHVAEVGPNRANVKKHGKIGTTGTLISCPGVWIKAPE